MSEGQNESFESIRTLEAAHREVDRLREELEAVGENEVETAVEAYHEAQRILDRYAEDATGTGDFKSYVQFRGQYSSFVEGLPDWLPRRKVFERSLEAVDKRRLNETDFRRARESLESVADLVETVERRNEARERYHEARIDALGRIDELDDRIDELERVLTLGEADLDAPVERLREPVERYNEGVEDAFEEYRRETSARDLLAFVERAKYFPLVSFPEPPADLLDYVRESPDGEESIPTLLEYAEYSRSKLIHYTDDADALKRNVATQRTYLERLDAEPLTLAWPPQPAGIVRWRAEELRRVVGRFAPEAVIAALREVGRLAMSEEFERLRNAAIATHELDERTRERLASGEIQAELDRLRQEQRRLEARLENLPDV